MGVVVEIAPNVDGPALNSKYIDVTEYVDESSVSTLRERLDFNEFEIGVTGFNNLNLKLNNETGKFSSPGSSNTIFDTRRGGSAVRISFKRTDQAARVGTAIAGSPTLGYLSPRKTLFVGIISEDSIKQQVSSEYISMQIISPLTILKESVVDTPANFTGQKVSDVLQDLLTINAFEKYANSTPFISLPVDLTIDDGTAISDSASVFSAIESLLEISNSVLLVEYPDNSVSPGTYGEIQLNVVNREAKPQTVKTFYNEFSQKGFQNILSLVEYRTGKNRLFNQIVYGDDDQIIKNQTSINRNGLKTLRLDAGLITDAAKQFQLIEDYLLEFGELKPEIILEVPLNYDNLEINILDAISLDYAPQADLSGVDVARYGTAVYGTDRYADVKESLVIRSDTNFSVYDKSIRFRSGKIRFKARAV